MSDLEQQAVASAPLPLETPFGNVPKAAELSAEQRKQLSFDNGEDEASAISDENFQRLARGMSLEDDGDFVPAAPAPSLEEISFVAAAATVAAADKPAAAAEAAAVAAAAAEGGSAAQAQPAEAAAPARAPPSFRAVLRPGVSASKVVPDISYTTTPGKSNDSVLGRALYGSDRQRFDLYLPSAPAATSDAAAGAAPAGAPLVNAHTVLAIHIHGGGWVRGHRKANTVVESAGSEFSVYGAPDMCHSFASMGMAAAAVGYRVGDVRTILLDVVSAIAHLTNKANLVKADPAFAALPDNFRWTISGHSAGAHIAMLLVTDPTFFTSAGVDVGRLAGVVALSGPYTVRNPFSDAVRNVRNFVFQRIYINEAFPADKREQDMLTPTWRLAQQPQKKNAPTPSSLHAYEHDTAEAPSWFGGGGSCAAAPAQAQVREQPAAAATAEQGKESAAAAAAAAVAAAPQVPVGSAARGFGRELVPGLPPTLFQSQGLPAVVLWGSSDLGLEHDGRRLCAYLSQVEGVDAQRQLRAVMIAGASHGSINRLPLTRVALVKYMNEAIFC